MQFYLRVDAATGVHINSSRLPRILEFFRACRPDVQYCFKRRAACSSYNAALVPGMVASKEMISSALCAALLSGVSAKRSLLQCMTLLAKLDLYESCAVEYVPREEEQPHNRSLRLSVQRVCSSTVALRATRAAVAPEPCYTIPHLTWFVSLTVNARISPHFASLIAVRFPFKLFLEASCVALAKACRAILNMTHGGDTLARSHTKSLKLSTFHIYRAYFSAWISCCWLFSAQLRLVDPPLLARPASAVLRSAREALCPYFHHVHYLTRFQSTLTFQPAILRKNSRAFLYARFCWRLYLR